SDLAEQKRAPLETRKQLSYPVKRRKDHLHFEIEYPLSLQATLAPQESLFPDERVQARRVRFQMSCAVELYERLTRSATPEEEIFQLASKLEGTQWAVQGDENNTHLRSPLGFELVLEYRK